MYNFTMYLTLNLHLISVQVRNWQYSSALLHNLVRRNGMCTIPFFLHFGLGSVSAMSVKSTETFIKRPIQEKN